MEKDLAEIKKLRVNESFRTILPPLTPEEYVLLEQSIISEGCRDAIFAWNGFIVDGHYRYSLCADRELPYDVQELDFNSEEEALTWIINNQLGRRNLTDSQKDELVLKKKDILSNRNNKKRDRGSDFLSIVDKKLDFSGNRLGMTNNIAMYFKAIFKQIGIATQGFVDQMNGFLKRIKLKLDTLGKKGNMTVMPKPEESAVPLELNALAKVGMIIATLEEVSKDDPTRDGAFDKLLDWLQRNHRVQPEGIEGNIHGVTQSAIYEQPTREGKTQRLSGKRESQSIASKEHARGIQESLWEK